MCAFAAFGRVGRASRGSVGAINRSVGGARARGCLSGEAIVRARVIGRAV